MIPLCLFLGLLIAWCIIDPWFALLLDIFLRWIALEVRFIPMRIRLEWQLFMIRVQRDKYLRMAEQIRKDLEQ